MFSVSSGLCPETVLSEALPPRPREPSPGASGCSEPREVTVLPSPRRLPRDTSPLFLVLHRSGLSIVFKEK